MTTTRPPAVAAALLYVLLGASRPAQAQPSDQVGRIEPEEAIAGAPITIFADLRSGQAVDRLFLLYRPFGESQFRRLEMDLAGNTGSATIPSRAVLSPALEYYLVLVTRDGARLTHPVGGGDDPFTTPPPSVLRLPVREIRPEDLQVVFLSPDPTSAVTADEALVTLSLLRADSTVARQATQLFLDGADITAGAVFADDLILVPPEFLEQRLRPGMHRLNVRVYNRQGNLHSVASTSFVVRGTGIYSYAEAPAPAFDYDLNIQAESRREDVQRTATWYNRAGYTFRGRIGTWRLTSSGFLTSDETSDRQPQNRLFFGAELPWLRIGLGDGYPVFPDLVLSGKRVRGVSAGLRLGAFNLDVAYGSVTRAIEGRTIATFPADSLFGEQQRDPAGTYAPVDAATWGKFAPGTFARTLFAVRPSFGSGETWQLGFTWLSAKDDPGSIRFGVRPRENVVLGTDLVTRFDHERIQLSAQAALSVTNNDISSGTFDDAFIDSTYGEDNAAKIKQVRDRLKPFITVNENLQPIFLTWPPPIFPTFAADAALSLGYFGHSFRAAYLFRGHDYTSFGQTFLRRDIQGWNLLDRFRLFANSLYATVGLERLQDNTAKNKIATTTSTTVSAALSYYAPTDYPSVSATFTRFVNDNGLSGTARDSLAAIDDATNRFALQASYDFAWLERQTMTLSASTSRKKDRSPRALNVANTVLQAGLSTRYRVPLLTSIDVALNLNDLPVTVQGGAAGTQPFNYLALTLFGRYTVVEDRLFVNATVAPTFGEFRRTMLDAGAEYALLSPMRLQLQFSYFSNRDLPSDNFLSLRYRYDL